MVSEERTNAPAFVPLVQFIVDAIYGLGRCDYVGPCGTTRGIDVHSGTSG